MSTARSAPGVRLYSYQRGCFGNWNRTVYITMVKRLINWLKGNAAADIGQPAKRRRVSAHAALHARVTPPPASRKQVEFLELGSGFEGRIENAGPGKNVLVSNADGVDDTGARESLKLFDDRPLDPSEPIGIDPYNSGEFDRSRHWDTRFRN